MMNRIIWGDNRKKMGISASSAVVIFMFQNDHVLPFI